MAAVTRPRELSDKQLVGQLKRQLKDTDVRTRDLTNELGLRFGASLIETAGWMALAKRQEALVEDIGRDMVAIHAGMSEVAKRLGAPEPRPNLTVVE